MELRSIAPRLRLTAATQNYNLKHFFDKYERNKIWPGGRAKILGTIGPPSSLSNHQQWQC